GRAVGWTRCAGPCSRSPASAGRPPPPGGWGPRRAGRWRPCAASSRSPGRLFPPAHRGVEMALINHRAREIHFKIVYYGPGLGGKTTNLMRLHDRLPPERRGRLISIATDHERTL